MEMERHHRFHLEINIVEMPRKRSKGAVNSIAQVRSYRKSK